jgi:hypothetical protein
MTKPYLVYYEGRLASRHLTRAGALARIGRMTLQGVNGALFEMKEERCGSCSH